MCGDPNTGRHTRGGIIFLRSFHFRPVDTSGGRNDVVGLLPLKKPSRRRDLGFSGTAVRCNETKRHAASSLILFLQNGFVSRRGA